MKICEKQNYFSEVEDQTVREDDDAAEMQTDERQQKQNARASFTLFSKFLKEVVVRIQQYKDELLAACLELVLSVPKQFVDIPMLVSPLQLALKIGLSYLPLANIALNSLEYWLSVIPDMVIPELPKILPALNDWISLNSKLESTEEQHTKGRDDTIEISKKSSQKFVQEKKKGSIEEIQVRVIRLLGSLGGRNLHILSEMNLSELVSYF